MPSPSADLATTWAFLQEGVDHIMTKLQTGVSYSKVTSEDPIILFLIDASQYMALYTVAYNYCTSSKMHGSTTETIGIGNRSEFRSS
jgi:cullin 1